MTIRSGFFNSVAGDRKYDAKRFAEYFASFIGNGVFPNPSTGLQVMANDDMSVTVKAGKAWINGYITISTDDYTLGLDPADGVLSRIDRIVLRYGVEERDIWPEVKKGTFASNPVAPKLQRDADAYELGLADILVSAGVVSIVTANITDLRDNKDLCGKVDSLIAGDINALVADLETHKAEKATETELGHVRFDDIPNLWKNINKTTLEVDTTQVDISIPSKYKEIRLVAKNLRKQDRGFAVRFNGDTLASNYFNTYFYDTSLVKKTTDPYITLAISGEQPSHVDMIITNDPNNGFSHVHFNYFNMGVIASGVTGNAVWKQPDKINTISMMVDNVNFKLLAGSIFEVWGR